MPDSISASNHQLSGHGRTTLDQLQQRSKIPKGVKIMKKGENNLNRDSFLKLLLTKLSHQDPIKPVEDQAFIAQMAQFSALEQMNNVSSELKDLKKLQANQLIGKTVSGRDFVHNKQIVTGQVTSIFHDNTGTVFLSVNGKRIKLDDVLSISQTQSQPSQSKPHNVSRETYKPLLGGAKKAIHNYRNNQTAEQPAEKTNKQTEQVKTGPANQRITN